MPLAIGLDLFLLFVRKDGFINVFDSISSFKVSEFVIFS